MNLQALLPVRLCDAFLVCCVFLVSLIPMPANLSAAQSQELRLFHEPLNSVVPDEQLTSSNQSQARQHKLGQQKNIDKEEVATYQYNGFIATTSGRRFYLINGLPLIGFDGLTLVSAKPGGRSLVLRTANGRTFELSVGESVNRNSL